MSVIEVAFDLYTQIAVHAVPFAIVFEVGNLMIGTFMRAAFGGKLWFGGR